MVNKTKILSELSKIVTDSISTFSGIKKEIEIIVKHRVNKVINNLNLVQREEFEILKKMVQKVIIENRKIKSKTKNKPSSVKKKKYRKKKISRK